MLCIAIYEFWKVNKSRTNIEGRALIFKSTKRGLEMCPIYYSCLGYTLSDSHCDYVLVLKYSCWVEFPRQHYYHHIGYAFSWMKREPNNKDPNYCFSILWWWLIYAICTPRILHVRDYLPVNQKFSIRAFTAFDDRKTDYSCTTTYYFRFMWKELSKFIHSFKLSNWKKKKMQCEKKFVIKSLIWFQ